MLFMSEGLNMSWEAARMDLKENVVRVMFRKIDGNYREMYATRNPHLIAERLKDRPSDGWLKGAETHNLLVQQKSMNMLIVFDLFKEEFRKVSLNRVVHVDKFYGVPGWISLSPTEKWEQLMYEELNISDYVNLVV